MTNIHSETDEDGTTTVQWRTADGRGMLLVILADGEAHYSVKQSPADSYSMNATQIEWPEGMKIALDWLNQ